MNGAQADAGHILWLSQRLAEAKTVKPAMSRSQLLKVFDAEAGLQSRIPTRYVLKTCPMIKIDVTFNGSDKNAENEKIATVSRVYLDNVITD